MSTIQYIIRNVPADVDKKLRLKAKKSGQRLNATVIQALRLSTESDKTTSSSDLDWFYGSGGLGKEELQAFADQHAGSRGS
jgi:hypothetical protein